MFSLLKLLHGGYVHEEPEIKSLLKQNRFLFIPSVNVDGAAWIEQMYKEKGELPDKRKSMHFALD
jgi:hypothetical protein